MRHRAAVRALPAGPPSTATERSLEQIQARLTRAEMEVLRLTAERDDIAMRLWLSDSVPQAEIAERLDRADRRSGGQGISYAATQKRLWRLANSVG